MSAEYIVIDRVTLEAVSIPLPERAAEAIRDALNEADGADLRATPQAVEKWRYWRILFKPDWEATMRTWRMK